MVMYDAETWTLRELDEKYLENSEMPCWRNVKISWTDRVTNEEVPIRKSVKEERKTCDSRLPSRCK
jgi:hypothetical protein